MLSWLFWSVGHSVHILCPVHTLDRGVLLLSWFLWALGDWVILTVWRAFSILVCVCFLILVCCFQQKKGSIFSLFCHSILLPSVLCSSDTVTSYFPRVKRDTPLFYQLLVLIHIFVLGSWLFAGSQHARIHPHCHDDIQTFSNLSSPGALCCLWMTPLVLMVVPRGREDQIEHLSVRIDGQSEGVWGTQWVTYLCQYFCFQLTSAFRPIFVFSSKSFQVITVTNFITAEWNKRYTNVAIEK